MNQFDKTAQAGKIVRTLRTDIQILTTTEQIEADDNVVLKILKRHIAAAADLIEQQAVEIARLTEALASADAVSAKLLIAADVAQRRERAAVEDSTLRKGAELTPIYTCGGHGGYCDDDDEDFWCPVCHAHLGTHRGYQTTCPRCDQRINSDSEPLYNYRDMRKSEADWRGPVAGKGEAE